ncbi:restriction endonuclease subunit S [Arenibacter latericius]|uniref:restriction endonuclease subunit S n=1 Tax=Arenibacter latericius TaxID=86104 RepID=UPI000421E5F8|nr:restriction endonuclease subunit S [Arenibacter latericius]
MNCKIDRDNYKPIGNYIQLVDNRNKDLSVTNLLGINITKNFMPSVANVSGTDLSKYKIIQKGQFAYSAMQVGRDETIRIALYTDDEPAIISPAYSVIEVIDEKELLPEYMMMWFQRPESDRYGWFISDSSVRASLDYERLCEIEIPIPHIDEQRKYVNLYKALLSNQKAYENGLEDLQLICDTYIEDLIKSQELVPLNGLIERINEKNIEDKFNSVIGISERKEFRPPAGKVNKNNLTNHLIVRTNEFAYIPRMNPFKPLAIALSHYNHPVLVSASYEAFRIKNTNELLPEFLFLFFKRADFDRYAAFNAWSSTRDTFDWDEMCRVRVPIPSIEKQKAIVTIYYTLETRKRISEQLKDSIKPLCPVLMRGVVERLESNLKEVSYEI